MGDWIPYPCRHSRALSVICSLGTVLIPLDEVDHDISGRGPLDLGVDVLPGQPRADVGPDLRLARLVEIVPVIGSQGLEEVVGRRVVTAICKQYMKLN